MNRSSEQQSNKNNNKEWTWWEDQAYEVGLKRYPEGVEGRWEKVASLLSGRLPTEVKERYEALDIAVAQLYHVDHKLPGYLDNMTLIAPLTTESDSSAEIKAPPLNKNENKNVSHWTEQEHRLFLKGLEEYGKGDWRSISRYVVHSKTSTQVASHAQKYFLRQIDAAKKRKRTSIHDINLRDEDSNPHINNSAPPPNISRLQQIQMRIVKEFEQAREKFWQNLQSTQKQ